MKLYNLKGEEVLVDMSQRDVLLASGWTLQPKSVSAKVESVEDKPDKRRKATAEAPVEPESPALEL